MNLNNTNIKIIECQIDNILSITRMTLVFTIKFEIKINL